MVELNKYVDMLRIIRTSFLAIGRKKCKYGRVECKNKLWSGIGADHGFSYIDTDVHMCALMCMGLYMYVFPCSVQ